MPVIVPLPVAGSASGWAVVDFLNLTVRTAPAAGGAAALQLDQLDMNELWLIDHAVLSCTSTTPTTARWYLDTPDPLRLLDGSDSGNFDVGEWSNGLQIPPSSSLVMQWTGASDGAIGSATVQARRLRR